MVLKRFKFLPILLALLLISSIAGVWAVWHYPTGAVQTVVMTTTATLNNFNYDEQKGSVGEVFGNVLNDPAKFQSLKNAFGNNQTVISSDGAGADIVNSLFGSNPTVTINGEPVSVDTILIQRDDVNNKGSGADAGNEYTLYLVVGSNVYAMVYGDQSNTWEQLGHMYKGTMSQSDINNLNVNNWKASPATYQIGDYTYNVGQNNGTDVDMLKTIEQLMTASDNFLVNNINNNNPKVFEKAYIILSKEYNEDKTLQKEGIMKLFDALKNLRPYLSETIAPSQVEIRLNNGFVRAEITSRLIALYDAINNYEYLHNSNQKISNTTLDVWKSKYIMTFYNEKWKNA